MQVSRQEHTKGFTMNLGHLFSLIFSIAIPAIIKGERQGTLNGRDGSMGAVWVYDDKVDGFNVDIYDCPLQVAEDDGRPPVASFPYAPFLRSFGRAARIAVDAVGFDENRPLARNTMPDCWPPTP